jgi:phosphate transport system permease protein
LPAKQVSRIAHAGCIAFAAIIIGLLATVTGYLISIGWHSVTPAFFLQSFISEGLPGYPGGMLHGIVGTAILILMAGLIGIPVGAMCGIYLSEYSANSWLGSPVRFVCDVLTGVPSIVVGILGYELLVAPISWWDGYLTISALGINWKIIPNGHNNGWAGAIALAFIMVPIVARTTEEMLRLVPSSYREASIALGSTKARTILRVIVPSATGGLVTGIMLAMARVAGETAPLLFTAMGAHLLTANPNQPFPSLTKQIFDYSKFGPAAPETKLAWAGVLVLISLIFVLNVAIRITARPKHVAA